MTTAKQTQQVDLSEYAEERVPFDDVIRRIGKAKAEPPKPKKKANKRRK